MNVLAGCAREVAKELDATWGHSLPAEEPGIDFYLDTADLECLAQLGKDERVRGFTTNATPMRKAGVQDCREFAARALEIADGRSGISSVTARGPLDALALTVNLER